MIYWLIIVKLAAIWILIMTHVLIVHIWILLRNHILSTKSWVSVRRLELLHWLRMSILLEVLVRMLLLIGRRLIRWPLVRHLDRWDSWYLTWWLVGVNTSWAPHLAYLLRNLLEVISIIHALCGALSWWKHRWSTVGMSWRDVLPLTFWGAHVVSMLHWYWHGHFSLSFCLGLWFDTVAAF